jgi:hypothetical protein
MPEPRKPSLILPVAVVAAVTTLILLAGFFVRAEFFFAPIPLAFWLVFRQVCPERTSRTIPLLERLGWCALQVVVYVLMFCTFCVLMPWAAAETRADAIAKFDVEIPEDWPVVAINHGKVHEFPLGTVRSNPFGFGSLLTLFCALGFVVSWLDHTGRGFRVEPRGGFPLISQRVH